MRHRLLHRLQLLQLLLHPWLRMLCLGGRRLDAEPGRHRARELGLRARSSLRIHLPVKGLKVLPRVSEVVRRVRRTPALLAPLVVELGFLDRRRVLCRLKLLHVGWRIPLRLSPCAVLRQGVRDRVHVSDDAEWLKDGEGFWS